MKFINFCALFLLLGFSYAFSQTAVDEMKKSFEVNDMEVAAKFADAACKEKPKDFNVHIMAGDVFFELEQYEKALEFYLKAEKIDDIALSFRKVGNTYAQLGKNKEAVEYLNKAIKDNKKDPKNFLALADAYIKMDSLDAAKMQINRALDLDPRNADPSTTMGNIYFKQKVYELALQNYEEALAKNEKANDARIGLAQSYYWMGNRETDGTLRAEYYSKCRSTWKEVTAQEPTNAKAWFEQGKISYFAKDWPNTITALKEYLVLRPSNGLARWYVSQAYFNTANYDSAIVQLPLVISSLDSVKIPATLMLAKSNFFTGKIKCDAKSNPTEEMKEAGKKNIKDAIATYKIAEGISKLVGEDYRFWGQAAWILNDTNETFSAWKKASDVDPDNSCQILLLMASIDQKIGKFAEAADLFAKKLAIPACKDETKDFQILYNVGVCQFKAGKNDEAIATFNKSLQVNPNYYYAHLFLADIYFGLGDKDKADSLFNSVIENAKPGTNRKEIYTAYGKICDIKLKAKKYKELYATAKQWVETLEPKDVGEELAYIYFAYGAIGTKKTPEAKKYYNEALRINPDSAPAKTGLANLSK